MILNSFDAIGAFVALHCCCDAVELICSVVYGACHYDLDLEQLLELQSQLISGASNGSRLMLRGVQLPLKLQEACPNCSVLQKI